MADNSCKLKMIDLYFSKYDFTLEKSNDTAEYITSFNIEYANAKDNESRFKVTFNMSLENKSKTISLNLQTIGIFEIDESNIEKSISEQIRKQNTIAIMFPFIRSQISLLTTQPGMTPIMLPPININALMEQDSKSE